MSNGKNISSYKNSLDPIKTLFTKIEWDFVVVVVLKKFKFSDRKTYYVVRIN